MVRAAHMDHSGRGASTSVGVINRAPSKDAADGPSIRTLRTLALGGLGPMYDRRAGRFVFRVRRTDNGSLCEGSSARYTAITAIGLANEDPIVVRDILGGDTLGAVVRRLVDNADHLANLGDLALTAWAGRLVECDTSQVWKRIASLQPETATH